MAGSGWGTSITTPVEEADARSGFTCGEPALDAFFARHAVANDERGIGTTFVLRGAVEGDPAVLGFYTLSMASVEADQLAPALQGRLPRYPLPVALIGRLGVHREAQGRHLGQRLLGDALSRVAVAAHQVGCMGVIVDAKHEQAEGFYLKYGFVVIDHMAWPHRLFLPMATIRAGLAR